MRLSLTLALICVLSGGNALACDGSGMVSQRDQLVVTSACLARIAPKLTHEVLLSDRIGSANSRKAEQLLEGRWHCMPKGKRAAYLRTDVLYGELAGAMLDREPGLIDRLAQRSAEPAVRPSEGLATEQFLVAYSRCLLAADPAKTATLLHTKRHDPAERAAVVAYGPLLSQCMPRDISYHMNIPDLRAHLAYAAYRSVFSGKGGPNA